MRNNWRLVFSESMTRGAGLSRESRMGTLLRWGQALVFQCLHFRKIISIDLVSFSTIHSQLYYSSVGFRGRFRWLVNHIWVKIRYEIYSQKVRFQIKYYWKLISKIRFWFKVKADSSFNPQEYLAYFEPRAPLAPVETRTNTACPVVARPVLHSSQSEEGRAKSEDWAKRYS